MILLLALLQWFSMADHKEPDVILSGAWNSCPSEDGESYTERVYEYQWHSKVLWRLEMGPRDEFSLFVGPLDEHVAHDDPRNLLGPAFHYDDVPSKTGRNWRAMGLHLNVVRGPGSFDECYQFFIRLERDPELKVAAK